MATETRTDPPEPPPSTAPASAASPSPSLEPATEPLRLGEPVLDALAFLDHRKRRDVVDSRVAIPGHYLALADGEREWLLAIGEGVTHLGRSIFAEVRLEQVHVSRRHAIVARHGNHVRVLDDRSSAGTFVNGCRIIATDLQDGDVIRLGRLVLRYRRVR